MNLEFDKTLTGLAGYDLGVNAYERQIKPKINLKENFELYFPDNIEQVAVSFIQGMFRDIVREIGIRGVEQNVKIHSNMCNLKEKIINSL